MGKGIDQRMKQVGYGKAIPRDFGSKIGRLISVRCENCEVKDEDQQGCCKEQVSGYGRFFCAFVQTIHGAPFEKIFKSKKILRE